MLIWILGAVAALVLVTAPCFLVHRHVRAKIAERANQLVADQVKEARIQISRERWDAAAKLLQTALTTEGATELEEANALWIRIREREAALVLCAAESALAQRNVVQALGLLATYLDDPHGAEHGRAADLRRQLELATSNAEAIALLQRLPFAALAEFAQTGNLDQHAGIADPDVRAIHLTNLREHLAQEMEKRWDDYNRRVQRIQNTPVFGELQEFVGLTRRRLSAQGGTGAVDRRLLAVLLHELAVYDPVEQRRIFLALSHQQLDHREAERILRIRANLKERFRSYKDFDPTDREIFDSAVDQELNGLLQIL